MNTNTTGTDITTNLLLVSTFDLFGGPPQTDIFPAEMFVVLAILVT